MTEPIRSEHEDYEFVIDGGRFTGRRVLDGYAYAANGNVHNPTPRYRWMLLVDGRMVDRFHTRREMIAEVRENGAAYLVEVDATCEQCGQVFAGPTCVDCSDGD